MISLSTSLPVSPIQSFKIYGKQCFVKRDDLLGPINGNKARKLHSLLDTAPEKINEIISCGGNQSNLMQALSILAANKKWKFTYITTPVPDWLKKSPSGNFKTALENGMNLIELKKTDLNESAKSIAEKNNSFFIPQGGHFPAAETGIKILADEIKDQIKTMGNPEVDIFLSSGTGTTAYYLARHLPDFRIGAFACVSGTGYLKAQMSDLGGIPANIVFFESSTKIPFGETNLELSDTYYELMDQGIEFDLIYDCAFWNFIKSRWLKNKSVYPGQKKILFIHSGGLHGNPSQLNRYKREYPFIRTWRTF